MPFRILILADLSGLTNDTEREPLTGRRPVRVDCETVDDLVARSGVAFRAADTGTPEGTQDIRIPSMDGFHPDQLVRRDAPMARLLDLRRRLTAPESFPSASAEVRELLGISSSIDTPAPQDNKGKPVADEAEVFDQLLGRSVRARRGESLVTPATAVVHRLIRDTVRPHVTDGLERRQSDLICEVDARLSIRMDQVLHDPAFQKLEASWRGLDFVARSVEATEDLELRVLDVSKEELSKLSDPLGDDAPFPNAAAASVLGGWEGQPWTAVVGLFTLDAEDRRDCDLLAGMGAVARRRGFTFFSGLRVGRNELEDGPVPQTCALWPRLRSSPDADHLVLATPRLLLRLPYGTATEPVDTFSYEEMRGQLVHEHYLWGSPAVVCAVLLGRSLENEGRLSEAEVAQGIDDLPIHTFRDHDEMKMTPCAEFWLSEPLQVKLMRGGLTPLVSIRGRAAVRVACLQTLSCKDVQHVP